MPLGSLPNEPSVTVLAGGLDQRHLYALLGRLLADVPMLMLDVRVMGAAARRLLRPRACPGGASAIRGGVRRLDRRAGADLVADYLTNRCAGSVHIDDQARFIDVDHPATHNFLHLLAGQPLLDRFGLDRIDRGSFLSRDRALTRHLALELYTHAHDRAAGLRYPSALDPTVTCYAVWDHADELLSGHDVDPLDVTQQTVRDAAARLRLTL